MNIDKISEQNILIVCPICKRIEVDPDSKTWLSRDFDSDKYDFLIKKYEGRINSSLCDNCYDIQMNEIKKTIQETNE